MHRYLRRIASTPLESLVKVITTPHMVPVGLFAPSSVPASVGASRVLRELTEAEATQLRLELLGNHEFFDTLNRRMFAVRQRRINWNRWNEFVYILVRRLRPDVMVETGVFDGHATAVILEAMRKNDHGCLISIDLPAREEIAYSTSRMSETTLPPGHDPGWVIPDELRPRHRLELGNSRELLPKVLREFPQIDIFMHDSLHTYDHMKFEFNEAWPKIRKGGLLLSDDVFLNPAYHEFCKTNKLSYVVVQRFGGARK